MSHLAGARVKTWFSLTLKDTGRRAGRSEEYSAGSEHDSALSPPWNELMTCEKLPCERCQLPATCQRGYSSHSPWLPTYRPSPYHRSIRLPLQL